MLLVLAILMASQTDIKAKKVHTLGDSTMAPYDENVTNTRGWGMYFGNFLTNGWSSVNYAKGGRDSRGGYNELWQNAKNNVEAGDYVLIQFAHNDGKYSGVDNLELQAYYTNIGDATNAAAVKSDGRGTTPSTTYKQCLKQIIDEVKAKGATPVLVSAVCRCYFGSDNKITRVGRHDLGDKFNILSAGELKTAQKVASTDHSMDYGYHMQQLATEQGVPFIDMTTATKNLYESYGTYDKCYASLFEKGSEKDNTHYNLTGALTAARLCAQLMKQQGILSENIEIPTDLSINPSVADLGEGYMGQSAVKELTLSGLGLDPASGTVSLTASDGILLSTDKENWQSTLSADYENGTLIKTFYIKVSLATSGKFSGTVTATLGEKSVNVPVTVNVIELGGGDPFTAQWALNSNDQAMVTGSVTATEAKYEGLEYYGHLNDYGMLVAPVGKTGEWSTAGIDDSPNQYVQFAISAPEGRKLDINNISMNIKAQGGGSLQCHAYYSTDGFVTRKTIFSSAVLTTTWNNINAETVAQIEEGQQLQIRIYPWSGKVDSGRWICIEGVTVSGESKDAAGVNITGSISYALDKGGLNQGNDVVMTPTELSAGFIAKKWTAGSALTIENSAVTYTGNGTSTKQLSVKNLTGANFNTNATEEKAVTLTMTPEDGFTFVPSKVSFEAARYGSDGGNISADIEAGNNKQTLAENKGVNRSGKNLPIAQFSSEVTGITATTESPLKVNFYFVGVNNKKSMGLSNVVIEGTLVGAAAQVKKYVLNTQVVPAEAGSISREPDMEQFKEGTQVALKATRNFGYRFVEWQDAEGKSLSTEEETTITIDGEKSVKAVYEAIPVFKVTAEAKNDANMNLGSVTLTPNDNGGLYEAGTKVKATANESKIVKFLSWTDSNENNNAAASREVTVNSDMTLTAKFKVQDFVAVFDASNTANYAYDTTAGYPFTADYTWDSQRNAKVSVVKNSDGSLCYTNDGKEVGTAGTPVVRNRQSVVLTTINGIYQNGYRTTDIAFQYQFSTKGFSNVIFYGDMAAKNMATKRWKALVSTDGNTFNQVDGAAWEVTANVLTPVTFAVPENQEIVYVRITGDGEEMLSDRYTFDNAFNGLQYTSNSESGVGNVFVMGNSTTGIANIQHDENDGAKEYYNLGGQRVSVPQKGVYIHQGKKIIVK